MRLHKKYFTSMSLFFCFGHGLMETMSPTAPSLQVGVWDTWPGVQRHLVTVPAGSSRLGVSPQHASARRALRCPGGVEPGGLCPLTQRGTPDGAESREVTGLDSQDKAVGWACGVPRRGPGWRGAIHTRCVGAAAGRQVSVSPRLFQKTLTSSSS